VLCYECLGRPPSSDLAKVESEHPIAVRGITDFDHPPRTHTGHSAHCAGAWDLDAEALGFGPDELFGETLERLAQ